MRKIYVTQNFQHGGIQYYAEEVVKVSPEDAGYFCGNGWASFEPTAAPVAPSTADVTLEVHDKIHGTTASNPS